MPECIALGIHNPNSSVTCLSRLGLYYTLSMLKVAYIQASDVDRQHPKVSYVQESEMGHTQWCHLLEKTITWNVIKL